MTRLPLLALAGLLSIGGAQAAPVVERLRGTIEAVAPGAITLKTIDGVSETIALGDDTKFVSVVKASLDDVKEGTFIGTATKGESPRTAIEVVLFPEAMRGTGEGHYGWDAIPDTTAGGARVKSAMTNGTVKADAPASRVKSAMTNGTVSASAAGGGERTLTVTYKDGAQTVVVPPQVPVVTFVPADRAVLKPGAKAFVTAARDGSALSARRVAVGKDGLTPPM
ncbi:metal ABC transporter permease [Methylobacterium sp. E-025]|uniref:metal ABC transporter permease n=1 Tax=Methylobacterium sp. E-025 TaxID=2836561 RepID=UPI001FBA4A28|nr:metal ABC transporter permease [Methylobacterium sp. E-025]MCJ2112498.1 metal ABC transporter permease [Methylobacterium sp. E-025]